MNGVHDMGGMHGLGRIAPEVDEPVFHERWEARALALVLAAGAWGRWTLDASRHARELIPGPEYLRMSYYEKWIAGLEALLIEKGLVTPEEMKSGRPDQAAGRLSPALKARDVASALVRGGPTLRIVPAVARFALGDEVLARNLNPVGHTRLPRYVRGKKGKVTRLHGAHVFPDANAHGQGERAQHLYQVRFEAPELWSDSSRDAVYLDLWESYLARA